MAKRLSSSSGTFVTDLRLVACRNRGLATLDQFVLQEASREVRDKPGLVLLSIFRPLPDLPPHIVRLLHQIRTIEKETLERNQNYDFRPRSNLLPRVKQEQQECREQEQCDQIGQIIGLWATF